MQISTAIHFETEATGALKVKHPLKTTCGQLVGYVELTTDNETIGHYVIHYLRNLTPAHAFNKNNQYDYG